MGGETRTVGLSAAGANFVLKTLAMMMPLIVVSFQTVGTEISLVKEPRQRGDDVIVLIVMVEDQGFLVLTVGGESITSISFAGIDDN